MQSWLRNLVWTALAAAVIQFAFSLSVPTLIVNDSTWYLDMASWSSGQPVTPYYSDIAQGLESDVLYPPGYPFFLKIIRGCLIQKDVWLEAVVLSQQIFSWLSVLIIYLIASQLLPRLWALSASLIYAVYIPRVVYAQTVMSEALATFLFAGLCACVFWFWKKPTMLKAVMMAVLLGLLVLVKTLYMSLVLIILIFCARQKQFGAALLIIFLTLGGLSGAIIYNHQVHGFTGLTQGAARNFSNRVLAHDMTMDFAATSYDQITQALKNSRYPSFFPDYWWFYWRALREHFSVDNAERIVARLCWKSVVRNPWKFTFNTGLCLFKITAHRDDWVDWYSMTRYPGAYQKYLQSACYRPTNDMIPDSEFKAHDAIVSRYTIRIPNHNAQGLVLDALKSIENMGVSVRGSLAVFMVLMAIGVCFSKNLLIGAYAQMILAGLLTAAFFEYPRPRFLEPMIGLVLILAFYVLESIYQLARRKSAA